MRLVDKDASDEGRLRYECDQHRMGLVVQQPARLNQLIVSVLIRLGCLEFLRLDISKSPTRKPLYHKVSWHI